MLPIAKFEPPFEDFFATPQDINFAQMCATYNLEHELITSWQKLQTTAKPTENSSLGVANKCKADARWRQENLGVS